MSAPVDIDALAEAIADKLAKRQDAPVLVDAETAAAKIGVPASWLLTQARERRAPARRLGKYVRFSIPELVAWADGHAIGPQGSCTDRAS